MASEAPAWLRVSRGDEGDSPAGGPRASVLFVCTGNICRSAFAASSLRHSLGADAPVDVSSAGTMALVGHQMDALMAAEAHARGIADTDHVAQQVTGRHLGRAGVVLVFGAEHVEWIIDEYPEHSDRVIGLGRAAHTLSGLPTRAAVPLSELPMFVRDHQGGSSADDWIADPYRRGSRSAHEAADRIQDCLDALRAHVNWSA